MVFSLQVVILVIRRSRLGRSDFRDIRRVPHFCHAGVRLKSSGFSKSLSPLRTSSLFSGNYIWG